MRSVAKSSFKRSFRLDAVAAVASMAFLAVASAVAQNANAPVVNVLTAHNNNFRDGQNTQETTLTPSNVNPTEFGKLFSHPIQGGIISQPLYVSSLAIPGKGTHNVVIFGTTTKDLVYAFDADTNGGIAANPLWITNLLAEGKGLTPGSGVIGTPVIDLAAKTIYLVSSEHLNGTSIFRLHGLSILTGAEVAGSPVTIQASIPGNATGSVNGVLAFDPAVEFQRSALLLQNGILYVAFGSQGDQGPYHGWLFSFKESTLAMVDVLCTSAFSARGGIWMSGAGLAGEVNDPSKPYGRMFVTTANGAYSVLPPTTPGAPFSNPQNVYGMSVLDLDLTGGKMTVEDSFTPFNFANFNQQDGDLGSGGPVLLPTQTMASGKKLNPVIQIGKSGMFYILDRDNNNDGSNNPSTEYSPAGLGGFNASGDKVVQEVQTPISPTNTLNWGEGVWGTEAYWNNNIYAGGTSVANINNTGGAGDPLTAYSFVNGVLSSSPTSSSKEKFTFPGPTPVVSSNGTKDGIVWVLKNDSFQSPGYETLLAYDATNLGNTLYSSDTNLARDNPGPRLEFLVPTIANGKVYVGSQSPNGAGSSFSVYGLFADAQVAPSPVISPAPNATVTFPVTVTITAVAGATIYYTTDGSTPTSNSAVYTQPFVVSTNETIKAIASVTGFNQSLPAVATYKSSTVPSIPTFSLPAGTYSGPQTLSISEAETGALVYYTTDGSTPTSTSPLYTQPLSITATETVQAIAVGPGHILGPIASAAYVIQPNYLINFPNGFTTAQGPMTFNGSTGLNDFRLELTGGFQNEAGSAFFATPVNIQAFTTNFTFQLSNTNANTNTSIADGITFTIQNSGPTAVGAVGGSLGYRGIPKSVAIKFDTHDNNGEGPNSTGIYMNGAQPSVPAIDMTPSGVNLHSGDYFNATVIYDGANLTLTVTDALTLATFTRTFAVNIPAIVGGNTAYVGFTGGTGGETASQKLNSWNYIAGAPVPQYSAGFTPGGMTLNGGATYNGSRLTLTDGQLNEARSAFFTTPVNVQQFSSNFQFQLTNPNADGFTFTIQRDGVTAIGAPGGGLGYGHMGKGKSVAVKFDLHNNSGEGPDSTGLYTKGGGPATPAIDLTGTGIDLHSGDIFSAQFTYVGTTLTVTITDTVTGASATQIYNVDIPTVVGGTTAYVGFTAGTGGTSAIQEILNWSFTPTAATGPAFTQGFIAPLTKMTLNGGAGVSGTALQLTDGHNNETRSAWYNTPVNIQQFTNSFDFQPINAAADGFTFAIQGNGLTALGTAGGGLGYGGLKKSIAIKFDLYSNAGEGPDSTGLCVNGAGTSGLSTGTTTDVNLAITPVNLHNGDIFNVQMSYSGTTLKVVITDTVTNASATQTYTVNIPAIVGGPTAYVGFTGASGGNAATQNILNWSFTSPNIN